ncbi:septation protein A [Buchnera aphidicola]|uniref:septation protein A n=1 Tax=Buchnera aphidicola TaxID=9 RepID=UPI003BEF1411
MKGIIHIFPILIFFIVYKNYNIFVASKCLMISSGLSCLLYVLIYNKIDKIHLLSFITILILGSLTIFFHNSQFIKLKVTIIYMFFSTVLLINQFFMKKLLIKNFLKKDITIPDIYWEKINLYWALFFLFCSILNVYISFNFSETFWVNFKVFGLTTLTLLSVLITAIYIGYIKYRKL